MLPLKPSSLKQDLQASFCVLFAGAMIGLACFFYYYAHHLTTAHYDAKAHLVVARRIVDSLEPGYTQIGVNWLPLIHIVYLPFVIFESQYRSGFLPSLISVAAFAISGWIVYRISFRVTGSIAAGIFAAAILLANPNLEYLQSCPLTEPFYMMLLLLAIESLISWRESDSSSLPWIPAIWIALGALCRYEGWCFAAGVLLLLAFDFWTRYMPRRRSLLAAMVYAAIFAGLTAAHFAYIYLRLGDSFFHRVAQGNPVPYMTYKRPFLSLLLHFEELSQMATLIPLFVAAAGLLLILVQHNKLKFRAPLLLLLIPSLVNIAALYWGMIYRLRYSVLLLPAIALYCGVVIASPGARRRTLFFIAIIAMILPWPSWYLFQQGKHEYFKPGPGMLVLPAVALVLFLIARIREWHTWALLVLCVISMQVPPLAREDHPMMVETLEDEFIEPERQEVLDYLSRNYDGKRILIDMGKLAPLVYDSALPVKQFVYNEGVGMLWQEALRHPEKCVGWLCALKGDEVSQRLEIDAHWADRYSLVVKTENLRVYRLMQ